MIIGRDPAEPRDDDWEEPERERDNEHEPARCHHGMPKLDCDWCNDEGNKQ